MTIWPFAWTALIIWLALQFGRHWPWWGWAAWLLALGLQAFMLLDLWGRARRQRKIEKDLLTEATDEFVDILREPDDNRPYKRFRTYTDPEQLLKDSDPNTLD